jgi:DNA-binding ferritin-like protein
MNNKKNNKSRKIKNSKNINSKNKNYKKKTKSKTFRKEKSSKTIQTSCLYKTRFIKDEHKELKREITTRFFEMLLCIKLFHWKTRNYGAHKATDEIYEKLNHHMDRFIEVLIGKNEKRINMMDTKSIKLHDLKDASDMKKHVDTFISYLMSLDKKKLDPDLYNIRDDIVTDMNQFLYLMTFE